MTDDTDNEEETGPVGDKGGPLAGERLAEARRQQQITVVEVAKELHLDERKVRALEQNEFEILGAPVFAKGHLRKYAQLVGVDIKDVLADYYALNRSAAMPPVVGKVRKPVRELSPGPWLVALIAFIVIASLYWYFVARDDDGTTLPATSTSEEVPALPDDVVSDEPPEVELQPAAETIIPPAEVADDLPVPETLQANEPEPDVPAEPAGLADGEVRLTMQFSGDCWTEITDSSGRKLFFDLGRDGRIANVTGSAPLAVLFGNAENVSIRVNGEAFPIDARDRRGRTARLTIRVPE